MNKPLPKNNVQRFGERRSCFAYDPSQLKRAFKRGVRLCHSHCLFFSATIDTMFSLEVCRRSNAGLRPWNTAFGI